MNIKHIITAAALCLASTLAAAQNTQDVVYLKNGSVIHGQITEMRLDGDVRVENALGDVIIFPMKDVERIAKEPVRSINPANSQAADTPRPDLPLLRQGYRGFVNWTFLGGTLDGAGVTTAHGYQIDGHMWAGLGIGLLLTYDDDDVLYGCGDDLNDDLVVLLPIFATFRYDFGLRKISPFAEASLGGAAGDARGLMAASLAGVRFNRFNIAIGWTGLPSCRVYAYDYVSLPKNQFTFRLGVDFGWHNW